MFKNIASAIAHFFKKRDSSRTEWKEVILRNCRQWLAEFPDEEPPDFSGEAAQESPDIYTFYRELCALRAEYKKAFTRNNDTLKELDTTLEEIRLFITKSIQNNETLEAENAEHCKENIFRPLTVIVERFERLHDKLRHPPRASFFTFRKRWRTSWSSVEEGFSLVRMHLEEFLAAAGIHRIKTVGEQFDPHTMSAVAVEETDAVPPNHVVDEISPGFLFNGSVLTTAAVKVATSKGTE